MIKKMDARAKQLTNSSTKGWELKKELKMRTT